MDKDPLREFMDKSNELQTRAFELSKYCQLVHYLTEAKKLAGEIKEELESVSFDFSWLEKI